MISLPNSTSTPITVGIDVAKDTIEVAIGPELPTLSLSNDSDGFDTLPIELHWSSWRPPVALSLL
jgi:transposase